MLPHFDVDNVILYQLEVPVNHRGKWYPVPTRGDLMQYNSLSSLVLLFHTLWLLNSLIPRLSPLVNKTDGKLGGAWEQG